MIYLTKKTGDKVRFLFNQHLIEQVQETNNGTLVTTRDGKIIIVEESLVEIVREVQKFEAGILLLFEKKKEEENCS